jgi:tRNA dimethylallyltransferase
LAEQPVAPTTETRAEPDRAAWTDFVAVLGPTASGKSALALAAARALAPMVELIAVDSMQVYRGMDIGTAKPTAAERADVVHHGLDLAEPSDDVTVVRFVAATEAARVAIAGRGHRALLVGGTGLHLRAVVDRLEPPGDWPELRAEIEADPDLAGLFRRLTELDPLAAAKIDPANRRRIARALEVTLGSGRPFSSFGPGLDAYPPSPVVQIGLRWPRARLAARIEQRFTRMMDEGLLDEVRHLDARPGGLSRTAAQALGYKELLAHLHGEVTLAEAVELAVRRTRQFAVRQERWFRRDPRVRWIDVNDDPLEALPVVLDALR